MPISVVSYPVRISFSILFLLYNLFTQLTCTLKTYATYHFPPLLGSMPPTSVNLFEEGAEITSFKIVNNGVFDKKGLYEYMIDKPAAYPGNSGCRNIKDVESDLKAVSSLCPL